LTTRPVHDTNHYQGVSERCEDCEYERKRAMATALGGAIRASAIMGNDEHLIEAVDTILDEWPR
jgi:hypothetical protein